MSKRPVDKQEAVRAFYAEFADDVGYYSALWHTFNVGHLMTTDLERICREHGVSFADVHLLAAARVDGVDNRRATDLAQLLNVSNAVLSTRIAKLQRKGFLKRMPSADDRRAVDIQLTAAGEAISESVRKDISARSNFVRSFCRLSADDQQALGRIMGALHNEMDREFISARR